MGMAWTWALLFLFNSSVVRARSTAADAPGGKVIQSCFLLQRFDGTGSSLPDVGDCFRDRRTLPYPIRSRECSRPADPGVAMNDRLRSWRQVGDELHELLQLVDARRTVVVHRYVVPHQAQNSGAGDVVPWRLLLLVKQRDEHSKTVTSQLFEISVGRVAAA